MLDLQAAQKCDKFKSKDIDCLLFWYLFSDTYFMMTVTQFLFNIQPDALIIQIYSVTKL
jgi:hypothetical protein